MPTKKSCWKGFAPAYTHAGICCCAAWQVLVATQAVYSNVPPISARADGHNGCPACARVPRASARREAGVHGGVLSFGNG